MSLPFPTLDQKPRSSSALENCQLGASEQTVLRASRSSVFSFQSCWWFVILLLLF